MSTLPENYEALKEMFPELTGAYMSAGRAARIAGPIDEKTSHLIQLAACAAVRSEGGVHSHARRALEAGATEKELYQTVALLMNSIGFPSMAATFSWVCDITKAPSKP